MEVLKVIVPMVGVIIGWSLSELGKFLASKKGDKQKLNKLIYFFLEIRNEFSREINLENRLKELVGYLEKKLVEEFGEGDYSMSHIYPIMRSVIKEYFSDSTKLDYLKSNIDTAIFELAEIKPVLAYDLSEQHNIKEKLGLLDRYISEFESQEPDSDIIWQDLVSGTWHSGIADELKFSLLALAKMAGRSTLKDVKLKIDRQDRLTMVDNDLENDLTKMFEKIRSITIDLE